MAGRDALVILPTGGGKSLVYQLPVLTQPNRFTVVVSPLIALSKDQVLGAFIRYPVAQHKTHMTTLDHSRRHMGCFL